MHTHAFTAAQAVHARYTVFRLIRERRFFLYHHDKRSFGDDPGHGLDPNLFADAITLDKKVNDLYTTTAERAEQAILETERELGLKRPDVPKDKRIAQCNRYTGGLDICEVYPLTVFNELMPSSIEQLRPIEGPQLSARRIWDDLARMKSLTSETSCVVLFKTRFEPSGGELANDFLEGKLAGTTHFPYALGYLFYEYSLHKRIVRHNFIAFSSTRRSHVAIQHWSDKDPELNAEKVGGYMNQIYFAAIF